jgi:hypothetical protein
VALLLNDHYYLRVLDSGKKGEDLFVVEVEFTRSATRKKVSSYYYKFKAYNNRHYKL